MAWTSTGGYLHSASPLSLSVSIRGISKCPSLRDSFCGKATARIHSTDTNGKQIQEHPATHVPFKLETCDIRTCLGNLFSVAAKYS